MVVNSYRGLSLRSLWVASDDRGYGVDAWTVKSGSYLGRAKLMQPACVLRPFSGHLCVVVYFLVDTELQ
jgi:hypothetical protein